MLPVAALLRYVQLSPGKPGQFLFDMMNTLLANTLHINMQVQPVSSKDPSIKIAPRYWSVPTGDSTIGKSPCFNMMKSIYLEAMKAVAEHFPFGAHANANVHLDGSHGSFN